MKLVVAMMFCSFSLASFAVCGADEGKSASRAEAKMGHEARVYVIDKEAPSVDKTVRLERPRAILPAFKEDK
ncbi:MAG TPA: hypothetical protein VIA18_30365 [Polyangia bacterium]|nr:hypothetical protein [Polyangia bacterium]